MSGHSRAAAIAGPRRGRLALCVVLAAAAAFLHDSFGVLLAVAAVILVADSVIPIPGARWSQADERFNRLASERRRARRMRRLRGLPPERLDVLDDRDGWASIAPRRELAVESIAIDSITGTVEAANANTFDRRFRPNGSARARWKQLWSAQAHGASLPPISVYRVDGEHFLRDGHHRVSVARDHGSTTIDADVVELLRRD